MRIIPAIDILDGKCVRLSQGNYSKGTVYANDPLEVAKKFEDNGIQYLHLVDLDGARSSKVINWKTLERIATATSLVIDFGGGVKSDSDIKTVFDCGAAQVTGGSIAIKEPEKFLSWLKTYGNSKVILGADAKNRRIAVSGWHEETTEDLFEFIGNYEKKGIRYCVCTDISKDGMLQGPSVDLYREIMEAYPALKLVASGGVSTLNDIHILNETGVDGVIVGKAIYEERISLSDLKKFIVSC